MGSNHARVLAETDDAELAIVIDIEVERALQLPHTRELIDLGKPVLVEKPVTPSIETTRAIVTASERAGTPLMCGFVERFNPVVTTVLGMLADVPLHLWQCGT